MMSDAKYLPIVKCGTIDTELKINVFSSYCVLSVLKVEKDFYHMKVDLTFFEFLTEFFENHSISQMQTFKVSKLLLDNTFQMKYSQNATILSIVMSHVRFD